MIWLEIAGVLVGLIYLWLEYKASVWLWLANIIMPAIYIFIYLDAGVYADAGINVYYLLASIYGWAMWLRRGDDGGVISITRTPRAKVGALAAVGAVVWAGLYYILTHFTDSTVPVGDSFTTALSIVALYMLSHKWVEQWLVWLAVDLISFGLYIYKDIPLTAGLYALYSALAVAGYLRWRKAVEA